VITSNRWHHVIWIKSGSAGDFYVDGLQVADNGGTMDEAGNTSEPLAIGGTGQMFDGKIDEVQIFDRAISADEALELYLEGANTSEVTKDYSGKDNTGNVSGAVWKRFGGHDSNGAYEFDGVDDSIKVGDDLFDSSDVGSMALWLKKRDSSLTSFIGGTNESSNTASITLWLRDSKVEMTGYVAPADNDRVIGDTVLAEDILALSIVPLSANWVSLLALRTRIFPESENEAGMFVVSLTFNVPSIYRS